ncbi:polysaccharide pyruvyl transferase family protein [Novosphingobium resinovorum]|uniref:polysaccharide pyruvyl transferase family protein n=1 Tax=Novosphingobium resinovorum TaxID=158500 RepID=UPI002ED25A97|nr:polysaccharide pyruvyl transferase family protein [Novosphingobium resinovorum]
MTKLNKFNSVIPDLIKTLERSVLPYATNQFALLDFPNHANVGDSAIWMGELKLLQDLGGSAPGYVCDFRNFDEQAMRAAIPDGTVFLHGGGNFGDIWNHHQSFREEVIARLPDRRIVQLPQSIHYADPERIARTARVIAAHPDFTLLVRDEASLQLARRHFDCAVHLCPDSAFALGPRHAGPATIDVLAMLRTDKEKAAGEFSDLPGDVVVEDWLIDDAASVRRAKAGGAIRAWSAFSPTTARARAYEAAARYRVERGFRQLARARAIVTDRLHVHILSLLLGRPHAVLDNHYGKIARFMEAFTGVSPLVHRSADLPSALAWARSAEQASDAA